MNSLNLKKKIAFISSLAMLAATAAYLPADIAKQVGFGSSVVEAATHNSTHDDTLSVMDLYVTVDGKYVAEKSGKDYLLDDTTDDTYNYLMVESGDGAGNADKQHLWEKDDSDGNNNDYATDDAYYNTFTVNADKYVALPYSLVKPGSKIGVVAAAQNDTSAIISDTKSVEATLGDNGIATVAKQSTKIIAQTDDSAVDSNKKYSDGCYETVDLSGLKFKIAPDAGVFSTSAFNERDTKVDGHPTVFVASGSYGKDTDGEIAYVVEDTTTDEENPVYPYTKYGDVYAKNIRTTVTGKKPGEKVVIAFDVKTNWTVSGTGITNKKLTLTIGEDNTAKSGLITFKNSTGKAEYYTISIDNVVSGLADNEVELSDTATGGTTVGANVDLFDTAPTNGTVKVVKSQKAMYVGTEKEFVNVYTVYTNNADDVAHEYTLDSKTIDKTQGTSGTELDAGDTRRAIVQVETATGFEIADNADGTNKATYTTTKGAAWTSPVMALENQKYGSSSWAADSTKNTVYFQVVVTNEYEVEVDTGVPDEDGENIKTKAKVKGTTVTRPEDPSKPGYTFESFNIVISVPASTGADHNGYTCSDSSAHVHNDRVLFAAGIAQQQTNVSSSVTPNITLEAVHTPNTYTATLDANGGYFRTIGSNVVVSVDADKNATSIVGNVTSGSENFTSVAAARTGYTFKGWAVDKTATEPLKNFDKVRPTEANGKITYYAVWEANVNSITLGIINFDTYGNPYSGTNNSTHYAKNSSAYSFDTDANTDIKVKTGDAYGSLPTPKLTGYTFDGWYKKVTKTTNGVDSYSAVKVSSASKFLPSDVADSALYAKFKQNKYTLTIDLDGGKWKSADEDYLPASAFKFNANTNNINLVNSKNEPVEDATIANLYKSEFFTFNGWTVSDGTATVTGTASTELADVIKQFKKATNLTVKANWTSSLGATTTKSSIALDTNGGDFYVEDTANDSGKWCKVVNGFGGFIGEEKTAVIADDTTIDKDTITYNFGSAVTNGLVKFDGTTKVNIAQGVRNIKIARPGYTFTGWYTDKECTQLYTFGSFPAKGTEVTVYAGWRANNTLYKMKYNLIDADGAIVIPGANDANINEDVDVDGFQFVKSYQGLAGADISAIEKTITYGGAKYVFDAKASSGLEITGKVKAAFKKGTSTLDGYYTLAAEGTSVIQAVLIDSTVAPTELGTVNDVVVDVSGNVSWSAVDNAIEYKIVKKVGDKTYYTDKITATTYKFESVPSTDYSVRVVAFDKNGNKTWGKEVKVAAPVDPAALGVVKNIKVAADRKTVTWDAADNATSYKIVKKIGDKTYYTSEIADTSYTFNTATQGEFSVAVVAISADNEKKWSEYATVAAAPAASLGSVGNVKVGTDNKTLTWSAVDNAVSYRVAKIVGGKTYYTAKTTKLTTTLGSALKEGNKVYLIAYDKNGKSVTGPQTKISSVAKATKVAVAADGKTVTWTAAKNAAKYQVAKLINGKTYYGTKVDAKTTKYTFGSAATAGTQVFVITFDADGNSSYSDAVLVK